MLLMLKRVSNQIECPLTLLSYLAKDLVVGTVPDRRVRDINELQRRPIRGL